MTAGGDPTGFPKITAPTTKERLLWRISAGLRLLSYFNPAYSEHNWAANQNLARMRLDLIRAGKLSPSDPYNVIRQPLLGRVKYITNYPDGSGRNWDGGFPDHVRQFTTIEQSVSNSQPCTAISEAVVGAARLVSSKMARQVEQQIRGLGRAADIRAVDLSVFHSDGKKQFELDADARFSATLLEFIEHFILRILDFKNGTPMSAASAISEYEDWLLKLHRAYTINGVEVAFILLFTEICKAAQGSDPIKNGPVWPFGSHWVCGAMDCRHQICGVNKQKVLEQSRSLGPMGMALAPRDILAYTLRNTISIEKLLAILVTDPLGLVWLETAAENLLHKAESLREELDTAKTIDEYYSKHHAISVFSPAAIIAYEFLQGRAVGDKKDEFWRANNAADEILARSSSALFSDFEISLDFGRLFEFREIVFTKAQKSNREAAEFVQKMIYDETLFPDYWEDFLWSRTNELPLSRSRQSSSIFRRLSHKAFDAKLACRRWLIQNRD